MIDHDKAQNANEQPEVTKKRREAVDKYCKNLNKLYQKNGAKIRIVGREKEIKKIIYVISRVIKNNPLLVGLTGVGKTALVEGFVEQIESGKVPRYLWGKTIYQLDLISLMVGASFQGELEERIKNVISFVANPRNNAILFIDEIHTIVNLNRSQGNLNIANLLKPALTNGELQCIGATTYEEYRQHFEQDAAFERRFSVIKVEEPTKKQTMEILKSASDFFEYYYKIKITADALVACIEFSDKYFHNRQFPDKAIDLLDETCARVKSEAWYEPEIIDTFKNELNSLEIKKVALQKKDSLLEKLTLEKQIEENKKIIAELVNQDEAERVKISETQELQEKLREANLELAKQQEQQEYGHASQLKYELIPHLESQVKELEKEVDKNVFRNYVIKKEQVAETIAIKFNLSVDRLLMDERTRLLSLLPALQKNIQGQDHVLKSVVDAVFRAKVGIQEPNKPLASFLFVGPTGVGKTEVALTLAKHLFDDAKSIIRLDMTEFSEAHAVSKLIGAPPGYVAYGQPSCFERVRETVSNVILFDEIEKCHFDVLDLLLQILDNGSLKLSNGSTVNFRHSIIIFTSNVGSDLYKEDGSDAESEALDENLWFALKRTFLPEFINRIGDVIFFNPLTEEVITEIIKKELDKFIALVAKEKNIRLNYRQNVVKKIFEEAYSYEYGARAIKRYIEKAVATLLSKYILFNLIQTNERYVLDVEEKTKSIVLLTPFNISDLEKEE